MHQESRGDHVRARISVYRIYNLSQIGVEAMGRHKQKRQLLRTLNNATCALCCFGAAREHRPLWRPSTRYEIEDEQSVKHEGPTTRKLQIGVICQALNTKAFASFCQAYDRTKCYCPPRHHGLFASTRCRELHCLFPLRMVAFATSSIFPVFLAWHCVLHAPVLRCRREEPTFR